MSVHRDQMASIVVCRGCGRVVPDSEPYPFACPAAGDGGDHVLHRVLDYEAVSFPDAADAEPQPFVRSRGLLHARHLAIAGGLGDDAFVRIVRDLDSEVARIEGRGLIETPFAPQLGLGEALGLGGPLFVKDETGNVAGSHKARHLFGVLVHLEIVEQIGLASRGDRPLAIASCGNAALAAAVVAAAGCRELLVFVPTDAEAAVVDRLTELGARVTVCPREPGVTGDPSYKALEAAIAGGAIPFTCQGNQNGMAIEGGETLGYEMIATLTRREETLDHVVVQVGGGALASAVAAAFSEARALGVIDRTPHFHTVQTEGAWPLKRAFDRVSALAEDRLGPDRFHWALHEAARRRADFMWPWETAPHSIAHGILDDETYDWLAVVEAMLLTRGRPVVVSDDELEKANALAVETTGIQVDPTGSAGLAGLVHLRREGVIGPGESVAVLFTGVIR